MNIELKNFELNNIELKNFVNELLASCQVHDSNRNF